MEQMSTVSAYDEAARTKRCLVACFASAAMRLTCARCFSAPRATSPETEQPSPSTMPTPTRLSICARCDAVRSELRADVTNSTTAVTVFNTLCAAAERVFAGMAASQLASSCA
eukprot:415906-Pleurochrysis_carterae.AAC.1